MAKKKKGLWDATYEFERETMDGVSYLNDWENSFDEFSDLDEECLADTHEALSKLYSKTSKRGDKSLKHLRKDWQ